MKNFIQALKDWLDQDRHTVALLKSYSGVSKTTITRAAQGEQMPTEPTMRKILKVIATPEEFIDIMEHEFPETAGTYIGQLRGLGSRFTENGHLWILEDNLNFEIFCYTTGKHNQGFDLAKLTTLLGDVGHKRILELAEAEKVTIKHDRVHTPNILLSDDPTLSKANELSSDLVRRYPSKKNSKVFYVDQYTDEEQDVITKLILDFDNGINAIHKNKQSTNAGTPIFISLTVGNLKGEKA